MLRPRPLHRCGVVARTLPRLCCGPSSSGAAKTCWAPASGSQKAEMMWGRSKSPGRACPGGDHPGGQLPPRRRGSHPPLAALRALRARLCCEAAEGPHSTKRLRRDVTCASAGPSSQGSGLGHGAALGGLRPSQRRRYRSGAQYAASAVLGFVVKTRNPPKINRHEGLPPPPCPWGAVTRGTVNVDDG